jgi:hypothetical protein
MKTAACGQWPDRCPWFRARMPVQLQEYLAEAYLVRHLAAVVAAVNMVHADVNRE